MARPLDNWQLVTLGILALPPILLADSTAEGVGMAFGSSFILLLAFGAGRVIKDRANLDEWFSMANYRTISAIAILGGLATVSGDLATPHGGYIATYAFVSVVYLTVKAGYRVSKRGIAALTSSSA